MATNEGDDGPREGIWDLLDELEEDELMSYAQVLEGEGLNAPPMPIDLAWTYLFLYRKTEALCNICRHTCITRKHCEI